MIRSAGLRAFMVLLFVGAVASAVVAQEAPPRILLDQPARIVEYQLNRLSDTQLMRVERRDDDVKYRPVYAAILTRPGLARSDRDEAVAALAKLGKTNATEVLLDALGRIPADDSATADQLVRIVLAQPAEVLTLQRDLFVRTIAQAPEDSHVLRVAYGALLVGDGEPEATWTRASGQAGHGRELLRSVPSLPAGPLGDALRAKLAGPIAARLTDASTDVATRAAAVTALAAARRDGATFMAIARQWRETRDAGVRAAATSALLQIPDQAWPDVEIEPLVGAIVAALGATAPDERSASPALDAMQLGERLAARLPEARARTVRRDLRAFGVQVVRIEALPEQVSFDVRWFAVEAGKSVQIVFVNPDAMPHNVVIGRPDALEPIGTAAGSMAMPSDPETKPFVPDSPLVLFATRLVKQGETERLGFVAPAEPGEYVFACTFPGHWVRMYGVMLVVPDLAAWEAAPTTPADPMTKRPFTSRRN